MDGNTTEKSGVSKEMEELNSVIDENRNLKIKIAGVDMLSSLLNVMRDELDTVCSEKDSLEVELAKLQCRCSMLEKDMAKKQADLESKKSNGQSKQLFESILKENGKLKNELKHAKKTSCTEVEPGLL